LQAKHIEYMWKWSIDVIWIIERNQELRKKCAEMKIDITKFKYGKKFIE